MYGVREKDFYTTFQRIRSYQGILAPKKMNVRYISEDVPTGLVPLASIGKYLGVPTPAMDALINLASTLLGTDYRKTGRTVEKIGLPMNDLISEHFEQTKSFEEREIDQESEISFIDNQ